MADCPCVGSIFAALSCADCADAEPAAELDLYRSDVSIPGLIALVVGIFALVALIPSWSWS